MSDEYFLKKQREHSAEKERLDNEKARALEINKADRLEKQRHINDRIYPFFKRKANSLDVSGVTIKFATVIDLETEKINRLTIQMTDGEAKPQQCSGEYIISATPSFRVTRYAAGLSEFDEPEREIDVATHSISEFDQNDLEKLWEQIVDDYFLDKSDF